MEGNCLSESYPPPLADICELNRSNSDASTLTAENCEDILHPLPSVKPDDSTMWTDEKHSLYLEHLEVSFVKQLHQSIGLLDECSDQNKREKSITQMNPINVHDASEQFTTMPHGCSEKINYNRGDPLSNKSADSLSRPWVYRFKRIGMHRPVASAHKPELLTPCDTENHEKVNMSHRLDTCSQKSSAGSSYDLMKEGTGQNFVEDDNQTESDTESRAKKLKTAFPDSS